MSWRGTQGGIEAAKQHHDVIMTPGTHCYFDHYQDDNCLEPTAIGGYTSLEKVYSFNPTPEELDLDEAKHILGAREMFGVSTCRLPITWSIWLFPEFVLCLKCFGLL